MRFVQIVFLLVIVVSANAGKITWDENGKPIMSETDKPIHGCNQGGFDSIVNDGNTSSGCSKR